VNVVAERMPINASSALELPRKAYAPIYGAVEESENTTQTRASAFQSKKKFFIGAFVLVLVLSFGAYVPALVRRKFSPILSTSSSAPHLHILPAKTFPSARCLDGSQVR